MKKRFLRLYPLLLFTSGIFLAIEIISTVYFPHYQGQVDSVQFLGIKFLDTLFLTNSVCLIGCDTGINYPSWSISAEFISYLVFGLLLLKDVVYKVRSLLLLFCILFFIYSGNYAYDGDYGFVRGLYGFMLGNMAYTNRDYLNRILYKRESKIIIISLFIITYFIISESNDTVKLFCSIFFTMISSLLVIVVINSKTLRNLFEMGPLLFLGDLSYSIYLNHLLIIVIFKKIPLFFDFVFINKSLYLILFIVVLLGYSWITRKYIEGMFYLRK